MSIVNKMYLKNAQGEDVSYDIGAEASNVSYTDGSTSSNVQTKLGAVDEALDTHLGKDVYSQAGAHNIRYQNDSLDVYKGEAIGWDPISTGGGSAEVIDVTGVRCVSNAAGNSVSLTWVDPEDSKWLSTKIVRQTNRPPQSVNDGTSIGEFTTKNAHVALADAIVNSGLTTNTLYYYGFFFTITGGTEYIAGSSIGITPVATPTPGDMFKSTYDPNNDGIIATAQGGTGNSAGYIRTGQLSGSTIGSNSTIEGASNEASGTYSHAEGYYTKASGNYAHAEGRGTSNNKTIASGLVSHAEGKSTTATGECSHTEGENTEVQSNALAGHAEGKGCIVSNQYGHAEGFQSIVSGDGGHAEGSNTSAINFNCHSEGDSSIASGDTAHAEGMNTTAYGNCSHAEGYKTRASNYSHAEGKETTASGNYAHAEGEKTKASGYSSHAGGSCTTAYGLNSFAHGKFLNTTDYSLVLGDGNSESQDNSPYNKYNFLFGHGSISKMSDFGVSGDFNSGFNVGFSVNGEQITTSSTIMDRSGVYGQSGVIQNGIKQRISIGDLGIYILFIDLISTNDYPVQACGIYYVLGGRILKQSPGGQLPVKIVPLKTDGSNLPVITKEAQSSTITKELLVIDCTNVTYLTQCSLIRVA